MDSSRAGPPTKGTVDLFNVLDFEPTIEDGGQSVPKPAAVHGSENDDLAGQELKEFYTDSVLLITGGTGFLGRVLLQKLLRTFRIKRIYLLVRRKNTSSIEERMDAFFQEVVSSCAVIKYLYATFQTIFTSMKRSTIRCASSVLITERKLFPSNLISMHPIWDWMMLSARS